jgi:hypothetical protein
MSLLYTVFRRVSDQKRSQVPNIVLNSNWIDNVSRSKAMRESINLYVNFDTTFEDLELLKKEMVAFVRDKENSRDFQPDIDIEVTGVAEMNKMELRLEIRHKSNWSNEAIRAARRSKFYCALVTALRKVPIYGPGAGGAPAGDKANPTFSVAITPDDAKQNATLFDVDKDKKRLVPLLDENKTTSQREQEQAVTPDYLGGFSSGAEVREAKAVENLVKRDVTVDPEEVLDQERELELNQERSNNVDEVRDILRRQSTLGRRRAPRQAAPQVADSLMGSRTIPTVAEPSPPEPVNALGPALSRVSYFEDTAQPVASGAAAQQWSNVAPLNYNQQTSYARPMSPQTAQAGSAASSSRYKPGNAFSQQTHIGQQSSREPVPGMHEMKRTLQSPQSPPR